MIGPLRDGCCVETMTVLSDGTLLGVGSDNFLYTKESLHAGKWMGPINGSCCLKDVTQMHDGVIVGLDTKDNLVVRDDLSDSWQPIPSSEGAVRIEIFSESLSQDPY